MKTNKEEGKKERKKEKVKKNEKKKENNCTNKKSSTKRQGYEKETRWDLEEKLINITFNQQPKFAVDDNDGPRLAFVHPHVRYFLD